MKEQDSAINVRDGVDDKLALSDRFGLSLCFHNCDQETYLAMVRTYAAAAGVSLDEHDALEWAVTRGSRSGRVAWHYAQEIIARAGEKSGRYPNRSEERREGKECVRTCRSRGSPYH